MKRDRDIFNVKIEKTWEKIYDKLEKIEEKLDDKFRDLAVLKSEHDKAYCKFEPNKKEQK